MIDEHRSTNRVSTRAYRDGALVDEDFAPERISDYLDEEATTVWLDLVQPDSAGLEMIVEELGLHPLAVEDALHPHQRPKVDHYDTHLFVSIYSLQLLDDALEHQELSAFLTPRALVTVRKDEGFPMGDVLERWDRDPELSRHGSGYLLYGLLDQVVDTHFDVAQQLEDRIDELEDDLFALDNANREIQRRSFRLRKDLVGLRRAALPMREVVNELLRRDLGIVDQELTPYFQDVYDHVLRVTETTETLRDLVQSVLETNLSIQSNRLNEVMKKLTAWAAIIAVPTAVTGFYGQNVPYPGFEARSGFIVSSAVMVAIAGGLYVMFRQRDWL